MIALPWALLVAVFCMKGSWTVFGIAGGMVVDELLFGFCLG